MFKRLDRKEASNLNFIKITNINYILSYLSNIVPNIEFKFNYNTEYYFEYQKYILNDNYHLRIEISLLKDDYYYVSIIESNNYSEVFKSKYNTFYYICDQLDGLSKLLINMKNELYRNNQT